MQRRNEWPGHLMVGGMPPLLKMSKSPLGWDGLNTGASSHECVSV